MGSASITNSDYLTKDSNRSASDNRTGLFDGDSFTKSLGTGMGSATSFENASLNRCFQQPSQDTVFSTFGETECGEPTRQQHIVLDFTPTEEDENEDVRQKCIDFWDMFLNSPEMQAMVVEPDKDFKYEGSSNESSDAAKQAPSSPTTFEEPARTAMSFLNEIGKRKLLDGVLSTKLAGSVCSSGSHEYHEHDPVTRGIKDLKLKQPCRCIGGTCNQKCKKKTKMTLPEVQHISKTLNDWTTKNPKSMEPPGHPPDLKHAAMQRIHFPII